MVELPFRRNGRNPDQSIGAVLGNRKAMSAYIYILQFKLNGRYYVGSTDNISRRLAQHKSGNTLSTRYMGEFVLVFKQEVESLGIARMAEKKIKSWKRRDFIEKIIQDTRIAFLDNEHP